MPEIARFYGIVIKIFFGDHPPPPLEMIEGDLPARAKGMVEDWARQHQAELLGMWKEQRFHKLAPLE